MSLFKRPAPMPEFVLTPVGWRPLQEVMHEKWQRIAAAAWEGYYEFGRGFLAVDFSAGHADFKHIDGFLAYLRESGRHELLKSQVIRDLRDQCLRYKPDRESVIQVSGARSAKAARALETEVFHAVVATPVGLPTPPDAYGVQRTKEAARESVTARRQQLDRQDADRYQKGLDPDVV